MSILPEGIAKWLFQVCHHASPVTAMKLLLSVLSCTASNKGLQPCREARLPENSASSVHQLNYCDSMFKIADTCRMFALSQATCKEQDTCQEVG